MPITFEIRGLDKVNKLFANLPQTTQKEMSSVITEFSKAVQKSAKLRAPRFSGQLAESIHVRPLNQNEVHVTVDSHYGYFQEFGFTPKFLPAGMPVQGGYRILDWMIAKGLTGFGFKPSGLPHPFIQPALEVNLSNLPNMLSKGIKKAIGRAKK